MIKKPNIIIVDDHLIFREGLKTILTDENIATVVGEVSNGLEFIELLSRLKPDVVIMDIDMPQMDGIEATKKALELVPDIRIIAYTMFGEEEYFRKMVANGAKGFILKSGGINELEIAICEVMKGKFYFPEHYHTNSGKSIGQKTDKKTTRKTEVSVNKTKSLTHH